jgi:hypothetical protein
MHFEASDSPIDALDGSFPSVFTRHTALTQEVKTHLSVGLMVQQYRRQPSSAKFTNTQNIYIQPGENLK